MIIRETKDAYVAVKQHDHALISHQIALRLKYENLPPLDRKHNVLHAIKHHDRAWIPLDREVVWDENSRPYDFNSYPMKEKLQAYKRGIKEVEEVNPYGALLCSKHYLSFFEQASVDKTIQEFIEHEQKHSDHLSQHLQLNYSEKEVAKDLQLLQFCDDLSLYICINKPGVSKEEEWPWFRHGFRQTFPTISKKMDAFWLDDTKITVQPFPFTASFTINLPYYRITSDQQVILDATCFESKKITIVPA